jgi:hypothetical protein
MSLEKWSIEEDWTLCNIDGWQCSINCPEIKRGTTLALKDRKDVFTQGLDFAKVSSFFFGNKGLR